MDFSIHTDHTVTLELLKTYLRMFIKKLHAPNDKVPPIVGFVWKLEYSVLKSYHYHFLFFMDANTFTEDKNFAYKLGELWQKITLKKESIKASIMKSKYVKILLLVYSLMMIKKN